tara:strand:+ start:1 stop:1116 length:1116 start_codon:yes stop_codon:yes gene_type:complete
MASPPSSPAGPPKPKAPHAPPVTGVKDATNPGMGAMNSLNPDLNRAKFDTQNKTFLANTKKKAVDCSGLPPKQRAICEENRDEKIKRGVSGVFGTNRMQAQVNRVNVESEKVVATGPDNNAYIVIGNDRPGNEASGYGGMGHTQCDSIDLCVGMGGFAPKQADDGGSKFYTSPNMYLDSARLYISQKTDVDLNFGIGTEEGMQKRSVAKSAAALKADNVRLIARESLALVTNTDAFNSQGGQINQWTGIHLIANNDEKGLQPIPVGNHLAQAIHELSEHVESLAKIFHGYLKYQMKYNQAISKHTHISPFYAKPTLPSAACVAGGQLADVEHLSKTELSILKHITNLSGFRNNYLTRKGKNYINSRFNMTN